MTRDYSTHDTRESRRVAPRALRSRRIVHVAPHSDRSPSLRESLNPKRKTGGVPGPASRRPRRASALARRRARTRFISGTSGRKRMGSHT